jgi:integrase
VPLPSYLLRRNGGRYHFQMRLGSPLVSCLGWSHLRCALRTTDSREARRRMMDTLDWAFEFRDAPDLDAAGEALTGKLESFVAAGPPSTARELTDRQTFEAIVAAFIARARERDFAFARIPGFVDLFKAFTAQNIRTEDAAAAYLGKTAASVPARAATPLVPSPNSAEIAELFQRLDARLERLDAGLASVRGSAAASEAITPAENIRLSEAVARFMDTEQERRKDRKSEATLRPILDFLVAFLDDRLLSEVSHNDLGRVDAALPEIPHLAGCTMALRSDLHARFLQARTAPWANLRRNSETTLKLRYQRPLRIFFDWLKAQKLYVGEAPKFDGESAEMFAVMPRDKFEDDEILRFVSAALFTGCNGRNRIWRQGPYFYQNDIYWIFLILLLTGMRTGEPPQIKLADIVRVEETLKTGELLVVHFFDMRPYDPAKGRVALKTLKHLKRSDYSRVVPIHPLLIDLGLLDRIEHLRAAGETRLFPGWAAHTSKAGEVRWGKEVSRAFDYARKLPDINLTRANISLYATRHLMADWLDSLNIPDRVRNRMLGHTNKAKNSAGEYGGKGMFSSEQAGFVMAIETLVIKKMRTILMGAKEKADAGTLIILDPFA